MGRILVLAGVNGAGKSSVGGHVLREAGLDWFNPDTFARGLRELSGLSQAEANGQAWQEGVNRIRDALERGHNHAFETTLGGNSIAALLHEASHSHDVLMWFCGLSSADQHIARVRARVKAGGHDIPEANIRARWTRARENLVALMPHLAHLRVYDNSVDVARGKAVPDPVLLLEMVDGRLVHPAADDVNALRAMPAWAQPLVEAALAA